MLKYTLDFLPETAYANLRELQFETVEGENRGNNGHSNGDSPCGAGPKEHC